jgi:hypothetical protein
LKHHAVALSEVPLAAFDTDGAVSGRQLAGDLGAGLFAEFSPFFEDASCLQVQLAHVSPSVGEDERSFFRP